MHADEKRSPERLRRQRVSQLLADPDALVTRFEGMAERNRADRTVIKKLESELAEARKEAERAMSTAEKSEKERDKIWSDLGTARSALDAYRRETKDLKRQLANLRNSKAIRLTRMVRSTLGRGGANADGRGPSAPDAKPETVQDSTVPVPAPTALETHEIHKAADSTGFVPATEEPPAPTLEDLLEDLQADPTPAKLVAVVTRQWFGEGMIDAPCELLDRYSAQSAKMTKTKRTLAQVIRGTWKVTRNGVAIPMRAKGSAFVPEPDRVMYCVHSTPHYNSNGYSTRTRGVAAGMKEVGTDVVVVAREGYPWDSNKTDIPAPKEAKRTVVQIDEVDYVHLPGSRLADAPLDEYFATAADAFVREARLQRPSVIQSASNHLTAIPALIAARRLGVPFVYEVRGFWELTQASRDPSWAASDRFKAAVQLETLVAQNADRVLAITQEVADELVERGVERSKIALAPNSVDPETFLPIPADAQYAKKHGIRTDVPVVGFAGSMVDYEGLDTLIEASARLVERGVEHQVVIAGSGGAEADLKARVAELELEHVRFLGRLPMIEIPQLLSTFSIMPCPRHSSVVTEMVSPLKPLEAFSAGKAVLMSDVSPHRTLAGKNQERALLFPAGDVEACAEQLGKLVGDEDLRARLGRVARHWTFHERNWRTLGRAMSSAHHSARWHHDAHLPADSRHLGDLRFGLVADEFTTSTLSGSVTVVPLSRSRWREQLDAEHLDIVFIESAWNGNDGDWFRGVGYYGEEENADLYSLLAQCRTRGIPTVFWNKEDPVHFQRFRETAARCDHVFTTDANMIPQYLRTEGSASLTASSLPFYAQPKIHNPLPGHRRYEQSAAYAGTYYGDRYKTRSHQLARLLKTSQEVAGLTIYDRQLANPESPYQFPEEFERHIRGVLPYDEVIDSYKSHIAQLNVNSVTSSPTMFSRRVVEVAACGGLVLSGPGRGVAETFGGVIPSSNDAAVWAALLWDWSCNPVERAREAWLQMRAVYRSHTVDDALAILARTAGIPVDGPCRETAALAVDSQSHDVWSSIVAQSVRPVAVYADDVPEAVADELSGLEIPLWPRDAVTEATSDWVGIVTGPLSRTWLEDRLQATRFGQWTRIGSRPVTGEDVGAPLARPVASTSMQVDLIRTDEVRTAGGTSQALLVDAASGVELLTVEDAHAGDMGESLSQAASSPLQVRTPERVVVAGHDLKFATEIMQSLQDRGVEVIVDEWQSHGSHDELASKDALAQADAIFCEWGLGNAEWYSKHVRADQRLVVRSHSQELRLPYLRRIAHPHVDRHIFVSELIRQAAVRSHGVPLADTMVIPNPVAVDDLRREKVADARFNLGFVGMVPRTKRIDRAIDLLERLRSEDDRYRLFVKGKTPDAYPWLARRTDEMAYYQRVFDRIDELNAGAADAVVFDGFGPDMADWYRKIGVAISVSEFESFHLTIADGAASGALPVTLNWPGAEFIYPDAWLCTNVDEMVERVLTHEPSAEYSQAAQELFDEQHVLPMLTDEILGTA
ncbi:glycosyltransferase involved in cell wall biosynthesis [Propioniferax innocua]|uniref:Glycosyltransferase involved in cell wall biosynthesis n=2 Tax=Propioniferax innocua TaxID=1753 RepID=A0A542ZD62_9ACTN|nr:glycosyltransferase involved in cell wall biosynthesis [Propioniferax innocua]